MVGNNDFIKPILYHDILAIGLRYWYNQRISKFTSLDFTEHGLLSGFYAMMHLKPQARFPLDELESSSMPPEYVAQETRRYGADAGEKAKVYAGIEFDVPWHLPQVGVDPMPSDPELTNQSCVAALDAGVHGLVASRDCDEMQTKNIEAFGRASRGFVK